jgi:hypothetical protein
VALGGEEVEELLADFGAFHKLAALAAMNSKPPILKEKPAGGRVSSGKTTLAMAWSMVIATIVVEIVLTIMFLLVNALALHVLSVVELLPLLFGHDTIRFGLRLHILDMRLSLFDLHRLLRRQATRCKPLLDACDLIGFALINARRIVLCLRDQRRDDADKGNELDDIHAFLSGMMVSVPAIRSENGLKISVPNASLCKLVFPT